MSEIVFLVEEAAEGGFSARALGESIFSQADIPNHSPLKLGTLAAILADVADHRGVAKDVLLQSLFKS